MAILILMPGRDTSELIGQLRTFEPDVDVRVWPEVGDETDIEFAIVWKHPHGLLQQFPNLKAISSYGAGVDFILGDPGLPEKIPIARVVDPTLIQDVALYVVSVVLNHKRRLAEYHSNQSQKKWMPFPEHPMNTVGILGLGHIGKKIAENFACLGFDVLGWDRKRRQIQNIRWFGENQMDELLSRTDYLICCLPLTSKTKDILNEKTFSKLKQGAYIINVARGDHLVEEDLIKAIEAGQVSGACLDVFRTEPLPENHPFWNHPTITVTPHIAGITNPQSAATQLYENYRRVKAGKRPVHTIDKKQGY